ncbi:MAG: NUDIX domain-containing protein [Candidatus Paceibacterota bacterium]
MARFTSSGLILKEDKILLNHRINHGKEYFSFPGGGQEAGETLEQTALREIKEETSISANIGKLVYHIVWDNGIENYYYVCDYLEGEPKIAETSEEFEAMKSGVQHFGPAWVPVANLPETLLYPLEIKDLLIKDLEEGFKDEVIKLSLKFSDRREKM